MITNLILILAGVIVIVFRKALLKSRARYEKQTFGIKLRAIDIKFGEIIVITIGAICIIFGFLGVIGVIK